MSIKVGICIFVDGLDSIMGWFDCKELFLIVLNGLVWDVDDFLMVSDEDV